MEEGVEEIVAKHIKAAFGVKESGMEIKWCPECHALTASHGDVHCGVCKRGKPITIFLITADGVMKAFKEP